MAQELREGDGKSGIARAGKRKWGYDPAQVDAFLERAHALYDSEGMNLTQHDIQNVSFDLRKNGYVIAQVDAALGRLERAVVDKQTTWEIAQHGRVTWKAKTEKLYHEVQNHAERNERERFKSGAPKQPSYDKKQVDRLVDQIVDKAAAALGVDGVTEDDVRSLADLNANTVNNVIFTQRKGKKGYDERQVDYFLNACVQLLSRLESYARVADFVSGEPAAPAQTATNVTVQANGVSPLFASGTQRPATDERFAPAAVAHDESFDALHQANKQIVLTSDRPPREMTQLEDRLQSRFVSGLMVDVAPPDFETRLAIIKNKAAMLGVKLPDEIYGYIAENVTANVRQIEGTLNKLLAYRDLLGDQVDEQSVGRAVRDMLQKSNEYIPSPSVIISYICKYFSVEEDVLRGQRRGRNEVNARQIAMYLIRRMTNLSLNDIGKEFGDRDHTTVLHSLDKVEKQMRTDPAFAEVVKEITTNINAKR